MKVTIKPGETVSIRFEETDGEIAVTFGIAELTVHADLPDTQGREGIIYQETFGIFNKTDACAEEPSEK